MRILILGGSSRQPGGLESFSDRAEQALRRRGGWDILRMRTETAHMTVRRLPGLVCGWAQLLGYKRKKLDCVWMQYVNIMDLTFVVLAKLFGYRVMVTPHLGSNWQSQSNPLLRRISGCALRFADRLAPISSTQEQEVNLPPSVPRSLIRNFLPAGLLEEAPPAARTGAMLRLIHSGRLSEGKGTFLFVDVCARLRAMGVDFTARITGSADEAIYARLKDHIGRYGLEDRVAVLGRVSDVDLLDHLRDSDFLVHLSRIDSYPLIVLEAMVCTAVPICMELVGARDMVTTYGGAIVSQVNAAEEAASYLAGQNLAQSRHLGIELAARVRADYDWEICGAALEAALLACCKQPAQAGLAQQPQHLDLALD